MNEETLKTFVPAVIVTALSLVETSWMAIRVGKGRVSHKVKPPSMSGPVAWECISRVYSNQVEQIPFFLVSLWLSSLFYSPNVAAMIGLVWLYLRAKYALTYNPQVKNFESEIGKFTVPAYMMINLNMLIAVIAGVAMYFR